MNTLSRLKELAGNYDIQAMDAFVEALSDEQRETYRQEIIDNYEMVYSEGWYDLSCDRISDPADFILFLLEVLDSLQRFFPDLMYYEERGACCKELAYYATASEEKLRYIQECLRIYSIAPQTTGMQLHIVSALLDKMEITTQFTTEAFTELLSCFRPAFSDVTLVRELVHQIFRVRTLPFGENENWHQRLLQEFENAMHIHAEAKPLVYLDWAEIYHYLLFHDSPEVQPDTYKASMIAQTALLLKPLEGYYTENADLLNRLGKAFADTAKRSADNDLQLAYYSMAVDFFTKGHQLQQAAWTFPVYATNALLGMAHIYHKQGRYEKLINTFEHGLQLFSQVYKHEEDFTLNLYWGDFLVTYTALAYDYKSPSINRLADEKLRIAAVLGENYHSHPYYSMAKLAIKSGNKEKCVKLLLECREAMRSRGLTHYDLTDALSNEDFREVWDQLG